MKTKCGLILAVGRRCGEEHIVGLKSAAAQMRAAEDYFGALQTIERLARAIPALLPSEADAEALSDFKRAFSQNLKHVADVLREDPSGFAGAAFWKEKPADIRGQHGRLRELVAQRSKLRLPAPTPVVKKLAKNFDALDAEARNGRRWYDGAVLFAADANLRAVVAHYGVGATVTDGVIVMAGTGDRRVQFGLGVPHGLTPARVKS